MWCLVHGIKPSEAAARLKRNLHVHPVVNTPLIEIRVSSHDAVEAARIANRIAAVNGNQQRVQVVDAATTPTRRVFPHLTNGLKLVVLGIAMFTAGLVVRFDAGQSADASPT